MNFLIKLLLSSLAVILASYLLPGVNVDSFLTALIVAFCISLLNVTLRPLLILLTIPLTVVTLGLFLLVINAIVILIADAIISGFEVNGFWWALLFSFILSLINSLLSDLSKSDQK